MRASERERPTGSNNVPMDAVPSAADRGPHDGLDSAAYHQRVLPGPALLAVAIALGLLVLLPGRRLQLAGFAARSIGLYALVLWGLAFFLAVRPVAARFMVPILLVAYLAPFVVGPGRMARIGRASCRERVLRLV